MSKIQELTEQLYQEGLAKGKQEGEAFLEKARAEADRIVREADEKAAAIVAKAEKDAEDLRTKVESDLRMAARQSITATRADIENLIIAKTAGEGVSAALSDGKFLKEVILEVAKKFSSENTEDIALILPESLRKDLEPFVSGELLARVRSMLRRREEYTPELLRVGDLTLNMQSCELSCGDRSALLPKLEYKMMELLMLNRGICLSTEDLLVKVWGYDTEADIGVVWVYISYLRKRLQSLGSKATIAARRGIGYLPQEASVFRKMSVEDNLMSVMELSDMTKEERHERLESLIDEFNLSKVRKSLGIQLSGGERRRCEIARALAKDPKFILLDEPFAGVDPIAVEDIQYIIAKLKYKNIGVIITDHNVGETLAITDRAYLLYEGTILQQGTPASLAADEDVRTKYLGSGFVLKRSVSIERAQREHEAKLAASK